MNILTLCMVCHCAIERGVLKATGRAPDEITWGTDASTKTPTPGKGAMMAASV